MISFRVEHEPIAQPRQRYRVVRNGNQAFVHNYTPARSPVNVFKAMCRVAAAESYSGKPLDGPVGIEMDLVFPRPRAMCWKTRTMPRVWHTAKPDAENVAKAILDALTGICWHDDQQVCQLLIYKQVADGVEKAHVAIRIEAL
jgi:crossover junction endodeoxyribonuclease RusA